MLQDLGLLTCSNIDHESHVIGKTKLIWFGFEIMRSWKAEYMKY